MKIEDPDNPGTFLDEGMPNGNTRLVNGVEEPYVKDDLMYIGRVQMNLNDGKKRKFYIFKPIIFKELMNKKFSKSIIGLSLIEILIGIMITSIMMAAMYTSYDVVNKSYNQVSEKAKISRAGRDLVSMLMRDVRMAGLNIMPEVMKLLNMPLRQLEDQ